jgi:hypothetical protein
MKKILGWIAGFFMKYSEYVEIQNKLIDGLRREIVELEKIVKKRDDFHGYVTVPVPKGRESINAYYGWLSQLGNDEFFSFYLVEIENRIIEGFINGGNAEEQRGMMKALKMIRLDIKRAALENKKDKNAEV